MLVTNFNHHAGCKIKLVISWGGGSTRGTSDTQSGPLHAYNYKHRNVEAPLFDPGSGMHCLIRQIESISDAARD